MTDRDLAIEIAKVLDQKKGSNIVALNVSELTVICDYMVIATGRNTNLVKAMADDVDDRMAELGLELRRIEGQNEARWIVMDYGRILVHIFSQEERRFYNLERLWDNGTNQLELPFLEEE
ncbi:MAG: ribosome silencing factor [Clostridia bacterium]|nr:ribosome silencing factor [Clostridia bacterium]